MRFQFIITILLFSLSFPTFGQIEFNHDKTCYVIEIMLKDSISPDSIMIPEYQQHGFYVVKNVVYDFIINGKKLYQSLVLDIDSSGFWISNHWSFLDGIKTIEGSIRINREDKIGIRMIDIVNGVGSQPYTLKMNKYSINYINTSHYCGMGPIKIDNQLDHDGFYYFTYVGLQKIKMKLNRPYLCQSTGQYLLRRR